ncbi:ADAMTS-like protein 1 isoform X3 [Daphnia pulex]|nr:ADAMTS-like protein 1 isoform X3 [Daphnia pulex]
MDQGGPSFLCRADDFGADQETRDPHEPQWSTWSEWAPCSRTCDGGATYQTRRCMDMVRGCGIHERSIRYQICNMQPCPEMVDFRLQQCQNYNSIPYQGKLYNWVPLTDKSTPACSLSCRAVNTSLIVQHAARVHDGTRCKPGSLDMCIDGICQPVGCDLQLNSDSKVDACGVCGGDGSTCLDSTSDDLVIGYRWEFGHRLSPCTASCDGGQQEVEIICRDAVTGLEVSDQNLCDESSRPQPKFVQCHTDPCPPKWIVGSWESCSVTCGGGVKERRVYCQQGHNNSRVDDVICSALIGHKARTHEPCNTHDCPNWFQGPWSQCSTRCGDDGVQTRVVVCRDARGHVTNACRLQDQPPTSRSCPSQPPCPSTEPPPTTVTAPNRPPREKVTPFNLFDDDEIEEEEEEEEKQLKGVLVQQPSGSVSSSSGSAPSALLSEKLQVGEISLVPTDPTLALYYACGWFYKSFIAGEWSPCSVTCGDGTREREVNCKIFLEFSKTIAKLPDKECPGLKPAEVEPCFMRPCSLSNKYEPWIDQFSDQSNYKLMLGTRKPVEDLRAATKMELTSGSSSSSSSGSSSSGGGPVTVTKPSYAVPPSSVTAPLLAHSWKSSGFSQCSASCLGGVQESIIECIREQDGQRVGPHLCPMERRPDAITRTCNDVPCPPRWNTSDFSSCSRTCGGGVQTRDVHCIHEVARGGGNTLPVGADLCPQPPPRAQQYCNMIDCPVEWKTGEWSQCSSTCDGGFKVRKVSCQQILALGQVLTKTANHCNPTSRPAESKPCNTGKTCSSSGSKAEGKEADDLGGQEEEEQVGGVTTTAGSVPERPPPSGPAPSPAAASDLPKIQSTNQNFVQQGQSKKKVTLKIGGKATVFKGTQIKIRCPVKHFDKSKISWMKDHILLVKNPKHELNKKGMLRIRDATFSDSGVYSCIAGRSVANITVTVRPAPTTPNNPDSDWESPSSPVAGGNRSKVDGHVKQQQRVQQTLTDELSQRPGSSSGGGGGGSSWAAGSSNPAAGGWEDEEEEEEEDDVIKEMKGNSLANGHAGQIKNNFDHRFKSAGRPDQTFVSGSTGPHFSDQDQDWHRQTPHFTYVTRARTTQPPSPPPTTTPTTTTTTPTTTTTEVPAATTSASVDVDDVDEEEEEEDDDRDDYYRPSRPESGTVASSNWPDRIDPIPTFWPTQNWWGTIDPMRQDPGGSGRGGGGGQSRQSNRIPTYAPAPATPAKAAGNNNNNGSNKSRNRAAGDGAARSGSSGRPSPSPPYFQLLLAGLVQQQPEQSPSSSKKNSKPSGSSSSSSGRHNSQRSKLRNASPGHHQQKMGGAKKSVSDPATSSSSVISAKEKGKADSLKFEWLLTPWSKCSQTCGGSGFQVRAVQCIVRHNNVTKSVEASLCEDAGLANPDTADATKPSTLASSSNNNRQPATVQKCGLDTCPHWVAGSWTPCHQSRCFTWNTALQKRQLDCVMDNGTLLDAILCSDRDRPSQKRECFNENCRGAWKVSDWSHCSATCDSVGHQSRLLRCVWYGTESPAGMACAELPRLPVTRPCRGPPCPQRGQCRDQSSYCGLVQTLELCYIPRYRQHCCQTCQNAQPPIPTKPADKKETDHLSRTLANDKNKKSNNNNNKKKKNHHHKKVPTDKKQPPPPPTTSHLS